MTLTANCFGNCEGTPYGEKLPRRRLGRSELIVPSIGQGGAYIGSRGITDQEAIETVQYAVEQGINYIDISPGYGQSERRIGLALEGMQRNKLIISTKTGTHPEYNGDYSWDGTMCTVENSLRMLKTDYIDLLLIHKDLDPTALEPHGALEALEHLKEQGVIKAIGLGQRSFENHKRAIETGRFDVILTFNDYHPLNTSAADWLLPLAAEHDVGVLNGSPTSGGLLTGKNPDELDPRFLRRKESGEVEAVRRFYSWCRAQDISMLAVVFQFCLRQPLIHCTLNGGKTPAEVEANLKTAATSLPEEIWDELALLNLTAWQNEEQAE